MTDLIKPAAPDAEPITPQAQPSAEPPAQPAETPKEQQEQPKVVTMKELEEFGNTLVKRMSQSSRDREKAIKQEVGALRKSLEAAGIQPTAEQEAKLRENVEAKLEASEEQDEAPTDAPRNAAVDQAIQYMNAEIAEIFDLAGVAIGKSDPEFVTLQKAVDENWKDPDGLKKIKRVAYDQARAKAERLQKQTSTAAARVVGGGPSGGQAQPQARDAHEAWESAYKK